MQRGLFYLNEGEIFSNKIDNNMGLSLSNFSDALFIENGVINIQGAKFDGSIFKSDPVIIKLKSPLLKYGDSSKIYIDFVNNGYNKTLLSGDNYCITSDDLNKLNIINSDAGNLKLNSLEQNGNSVIFVPILFSVSFNSLKKISLISLIEENEEEEIFYYGKEIILSQEHFPINENQYITRIYDQNGKNYEIGEKVKIVEDLQFSYDISYKNKIVLDFVDYQENILIIPDDYIYLPSYRNDYSIKRSILKWKDIETNEIFEKSEKIQGNKNRTIQVIYNVDYFSIKIMLLNNHILSDYLAYDETLNFPDANIPEYNHLKGWVDSLTNETYINLTSIDVKRDYCFSPIIVSYIKYYLDKKVIEEKEYIVNSTFTLFENEKTIEKKVKHWLDKKNNVKYYYDEEYILSKDLELYAVYDKKDDNNNTALIVIIIIAVILFLIGAFLTYRYVRRKNIDNKIEEIPKDTGLTPTS